MITDRRMIAFSICTAMALCSGASAVLMVLGFDVTRFASSLTFLFFCTAPACYALWANRAMTLEQARGQADTKAQNASTAEREARLVGDKPAAVVVVSTRAIAQNGETVEVEMVERRPANWLAWRQADVDGLLWARAQRDNITSTAMVGPGKAFGEVPSWQVWVDHLADNGLAAPRRNGVGSKLLYPAAECLRRVRSDQVTMPSDKAPAVARPPLRPLPAFSGFSSSEPLTVDSEKGS